ncbi:MAG: hypothetical protein IKZ87_07575 [Actinomycetaceae bacterium]|nr:hypothetical protein [Actinomycetaceae bacterium]
MNDEKPLEDSSVQLNQLLANARSAAQALRYRWAQQAQGAIAKAHRDAAKQQQKLAEAQAEHREKQALDSRNKTMAASERRSQVQAARSMAERTQRPGWFDTAHPREIAKAGLLIFAYAQEDDVIWDIKQRFERELKGRGVKIESLGDLDKISDEELAEMMKDVPGNDATPEQVREDFAASMNTGESSTGSEEETEEVKESATYGAEGEARRIAEGDEELATGVTLRDVTVTPPLEERLAAQENTPQPPMKTMPAPSIDMGGPQMGM